MLRSPPAPEVLQSVVPERKQIVSPLTLTLSHTMWDDGRTKSIQSTNTNQLAQQSALAPSPPHQPLLRAELPARPLAVVVVADQLALLSLLSLLLLLLSCQHQHQHPSPSTLLSSQPSRRRRGMNRRASAQTRTSPPSTSPSSPLLLHRLPPPRQSTPPPSRTRRRNRRTPVQRRTPLLSASRAHLPRHLSSALPSSSVDALLSCPERLILLSSALGRRASERRMVALMLRLRLLYSLACLLRLFLRALRPPRRPIVLGPRSSSDSGARRTLVSRSHRLEPVLPVTARMR